MEKNSVSSEYINKVKSFQHKVLFYSFSNFDLLLQSLIHKSYVFENSICGRDYERLEFLGDAVLSLVVAEQMMARFPGFDEGELSRIRAYYVNDLSLAEAARRYSLGEYILMGKGEESTGGRDRDSILADVMESLIGAVYLDGGLGAAAEVIPRLLPEILSEQVEKAVAKDFKSIMQEYFQKKRQARPKYCLVSENGPDHEKIFTVEISVNDKVLGLGQGRSKKEAEQAAAEAAWNGIKELEKD